MFKLNNNLAELDTKKRNTITQNFQLSAGIKMEKSADLIDDEFSLQKDEISVMKRKQRNSHLMTILTDKELESYRDKISNALLKP
mmetsp:Transcript_36036/g.41619  ORF Transcript_36036/g.41619 Transcript_36036/m.41619 type:complete len:85 (+) Transcript_36036:1063-1317(+)